ncbi:unnamed protein product [Rhizophagus irregularis]|nr:unnamed protein product [Rhizophagus irregularis]
MNNPPDGYSTDTVMADFYIVTIIPLTLNILNLLGSSYIFYRTYLRWKFDYDNFNLLSIKFPFYIAITDFLFSEIILIDFSYTVSNVSALETFGEPIVWPTPFCEILGFFNVSFTLLNMLLVGSISFVTWLRVVQEYYFDWGKCDYKIWFPVGFLSFIIPMVSVRDLGAKKYWCGIKDGSNSLISTLLLITILLTLLTIVFCYVHVLKTFHDVKDDNSSSIAHSEVNMEQRNIIERRILAKVLTYILVFIFQYIPLMLNDIFELVKVHYILLNAISLSAISIGGISNLFQYVRNERFLIIPNNSILNGSDSLNNNINLEEREQTKTITDFLFSEIILIDFSYTVSNVSALETFGEPIVWPTPFCEILGFFNVSFTLLNMLLVGSISFVTWLRVVQEYYFDWGKCDYKIWFPVGFLSFIIPMVSVRDLGAKKYWCGIKDGSNSLISTLLLITILLTLLTIVFCYVHVLKTFHDVKDDNSSSIAHSEVNMEQRNIIERRILAKVLTYILVFIFQYIPLMLNDIFELVKVHYILLNAISLSAISIGGISNLFQYVRNERFLIIPNNSILNGSDSLNNNINLEEREQTKSLN